MIMRFPILALSSAIALLAVDEQVFYETIFRHGGQRYTRYLHRRKQRLNLIFRLLPLSFRRQLFKSMSHAADYDATQANGGNNRRAMRNEFYRSTRCKGIVPRPTLYRPEFSSSGWASRSPGSSFPSAIISSQPLSMSWSCCRTCSRAPPSSPPGWCRLSDKACRPASSA